MDKNSKMRHYIMNAQAFVQEIIKLHETCILRWKNSTVMIESTDFLKIVEENHAFNYQLWLAEDEARRDDLGFEHVYRAKRHIDQLNQKRNDCVEMLDRALVVLLSPSKEPSCPINSETPGMMIDRLSILALKQYHMHLQTDHPEASLDHKERCTEKLNIIKAQLTQVASCLEIFICEIQTQIRTFRLYQQHKMYNDPSYL